MKRAVSLLYLGFAKGIDTQYQTYDWFQLLGLEKLTELPEDNFYFLHTVSQMVPVPRVIVLSEFDKMPQKGVRFSRGHVFIRDQFTCQYCLQEFPRQKLNLDHVMPRSRGGKTSWENVVTSCHACNRRKADRTPSEANMPLSRKPQRPQASWGLIQRKHLDQSWRAFLLPSST